jgi:hypothetical protein
MMDCTCSISLDQEAQENNVRICLSGQDQYSIDYPRRLRNSLSQRRRQEVTSKLSFSSHDPDRAVQ